MAGFLAINDWAAAIKENHSTKAAKTTHHRAHESDGRHTTGEGHDTDNGFKPVGKLLHEPTATSKTRLKDKISSKTKMLQQDTDHPTSSTNSITSPIGQNTSAINGTALSNQHPPAPPEFTAREWKWAGGMMAFVVLMLLIAFLPKLYYGSRDWIRKKRFEHYSTRPRTEATGRSDPSETKQSLLPNARSVYDPRTGDFVVEGTVGPGTYAAGDRLARPSSAHVRFG
ncbi:hypothetical protein LTR37_008458 [Vermiconidia calcicola]|uniref:Uncharacterized protein n=1 Tax=Vermiconidia calcicola TaxID=1690605 RepID=A0ACC3NAK6_9PEZI|nr:hypothetical protein LTR37_008458 [Vermiconidia calcicola]